MKLMHLFYFARPRVSSGSDGLYVYSLSDMSPATSDCLGPYFSVCSFFSNYRVCVDFSGSFHYFLFFTIRTLLGVVSM